MTFVAEGFLEINKGFVMTAVKIVREQVSGFYEVTLASGGTLHHVAGKYLTFRAFSDEPRTPVTIQHAKTYPARRSGAHSHAQPSYEQLTLW